MTGRLARLAILSLALCCAGALAPARAQSPGGALVVQCPDRVPEGEIFLVDIAGNAKASGVTVYWLGRELSPQLVTKNGKATAVVMLGVGMKELLSKSSYELKVVMRGAKGDETFTKTITRTTDKQYPEQHLEVDKRFTNLNDADIQRDRREKALQRAAYATVTPEKSYSLPFARPVKGGVNSAFGLRRFFNGVPKKPHSGLDLKARTGDPVSAIDNGRVILTGFHYFAGGSVYVDHGQGVISQYFHLSKILVEEGQQVSRGELLGEAGQTGRVTGPHLHLGLVVLGQLVDPTPLLAE